MGCGCSVIISRETLSPCAVSAQFLTTTSPVWTFSSPHKCSDYLSKSCFNYQEWVRQQHEEQVQQKTIRLNSNSNNININHKATNNDRENAGKDRFYWYDLGENFWRGGRPGEEKRWGAGAKKLMWRNISVIKGKNKQTSFLLKCHFNLVWRIPTQHTYSQNKQTNKKK